MSTTQGYSGFDFPGQEFPGVKQQPLDEDFDDDGNDEPEGGSATSTNPQAAADFVKKLHRMLDEKQISLIVSWSEAGDSFIIRDQNEFSKHVLPRHFKHNNFASFVRQLNKYDFHKVKTNEPKSKGLTEQMWEFKHPNFVRNGFDQLSSIKRKAPQKKGKDETEPKSAEELQAQVETLGVIQKDMANYLQTLSKNYESVVREVIMFKKNMAAQDQLIQNLLQYLVSKEVTEPKKQPALAGTADPNYYISQQLTAPPLQSLVAGPAPSSEFVIQQNLPQPSPLRESLTDLGSIPQQQTPFPQQHQLQGSWELPPEAISGSIENFQNVAQLSFAQMEEMSKRAKPDSQQAKPEEALTVHSVGMLRPKPENQQGNSSSMRVFRKTFVPAWSVPPKVLVVEDDIASRQLASKFLQVMGCSYEIAQDGLEAVNKMNLSKYDLVLMDIVMPQMDGISATTQIRQFDASTPVISMTSNTSREDCIEYLSNGMNDILPKPFSRDSLKAMLEHYCSHLKNTPEFPLANVTEYPEDASEPASKRMRYSEPQSN